LAVLGAALPWATAFGGVFTKAGTEGDGIVTLIVGLACGLIGALRLAGVLARTASTVLLSLAGAGIALVGIIDLVDLQQRVADAGVQGVSAGSGLYLTILAGGSILVGALLDSGRDLKN